MGGLQGEVQVPLLRPHRDGHQAGGVRHADPLRRVHHPGREEDH